MSDEDEEDIQKVLDSISPYEKANYHIIFTGKKDKDGNWEYYRIKKLPLVSILGTATEQAMTKTLLNSYGISYTPDKESLKKSIELSAPLDPRNMVTRIPTASAALTYVYNEDTFTGDRIFYEPRDRKVEPYAEGLYSDNVDDIYKVLSPIFGDFSPARMQKAVEKIITNENTNPSIAIFYMITNGIFDTGNDEFKENSDTFDNGLDRVLGNFGKKFKRSTNPNVLRYKEEEKLEELEKKLDTDEYVKKKKIQKTIKRDINPEILRNGTKSEYKKEKEKMMDILKEYNIEDKRDQRYYASYALRLDIKGDEVFKSMADIIYERDPKMMAARLYSRYGNNIDEEEKKELSENFSVAKASNAILKKGYYFYEKNYLNKSQEQIDKFESTFGKVR
jgi:hypothetical protein